MCLSSGFKFGRFREELGTNSSCVFDTLLETTFNKLRVSKEAQIVDKI